MTQGITITVSEGCDGSKCLIFDGSTLADSLVSRSATLRDLLDLDGEAPLPIAPKDFLLWYSFSESQAYSVKDLADVTEVRLTCRWTLLTAALAGRPHCNSLLAGRIIPR